MDRRLELVLLERLLDLHRANTTSEAAAPRRQRTAVYVDPQWHQAELETLLLGQPLVAGLSCELDGPGAYFTANVGPVPVLVVRQADGRPRAFLNACRHRGSAVAHGRGKAASTFVCRYHGWSYALDGALKGRPGARDAFAGEDACSSLIELPCAEDCGVVVVGTSAGVEANARALLGGYADEIASHALAGYRLVGEQEKEWAFNWKLGFETFLESYHISSLHRDTLARQLKSAPMLCEFAGRHGRGIVMGNKAAELLDMPQSDWGRFGRATLVYWLFPNAILSMPQSGHAELWTFLSADNRPDRCTISVRFFAAPSAPQNAEFWERLIGFTMSVVDAEDFYQQTLIQRNLRSGLLHDRVFGRNEPALTHFHEQLDQVVGTARKS